MRDKALARYEKLWREAKRFNDDDKEIFGEIVNALRRSQDHTSIQNRLNVMRKVLEEFSTAAKSWHDFHHGSDTVQCDWICELIPKAKTALCHSLPIGQRGEELSAQSTSEAK
jgi:hypothetical protein